MTKHANTDLVGVAWLKTVPGLDPTAVATRLPKTGGEVDVTKLRTSGFVVWRSGLGGVSSGKLRRAIGVAEFWAAPDAGSSQVPWGRASDITEAVYAELSDEFSTVANAVTVTLPGDYHPARVHTVRALGEPQKVEGDPSGFARFDINIEINWTERSA
jgi:hypothetical protein